MAIVRIICPVIVFILIFQTSYADSDEVIFKPRLTSKSKPDSTTDSNTILFRDRNKILQKTQKNCNIYTTQACNGVRNVGIVAMFQQENTMVEKPSSVESPISEQTAEELVPSSYFIINHTSASMNPVSSSLNSTIKTNSYFFVVGGKISAPSEYPHMALIGFGNYEEVRWLCGGSLISEQYVLSAAHCSVTNAGPALWIRLSELDLVEKDNIHRKDFRIIERIVHPGYKAPTLYNDIALFKLNVSVTFNEHRRPICLNTLQQLGVTRGVATGWGATGYGETESNKLLYVDLDIVDHEKCDKIYRGERLPNGFNTNTMICAGVLSGGKDTCQGDSGGPLQVPFNGGCSRLYLQLGIVSFGEGCAFPDTPGVYTRVSYYIPWIESIVWK